MKKLSGWRGVLFGVVYGLVARAIFALEDFRVDDPIVSTFGLMTLSFMFIVPFVVGLIVAYGNRDITSSGKIVGITTPVFAVVAMTVFAVLSGWEGIICALMALPIFMMMSLIGGLLGIAIFKRNRNKLYVSAFVLLPFLVAPLEHKFGFKDKIFKEQTSMEINAGEKIVWDNITRVYPITERENSNSLFQIMGFPRPIEAQLDTIAVGGIRKAIFARGLFFTETVTKVEPLRVLAFSIKADPKSIPPQALDEHVMVGGKYFDVLEGKYEIVKTGNNKIVLHLTSQFRLSTPFNFYSGLWSRLIMRDIQKNILLIIKRRSEGASVSPAT
jgi:hypothetical protein